MGKSISSPHAGIAKAADRRHGALDQEGPVVSVFASGADPTD
jgi:hypothetical protein